MAYHMVGNYFGVAPGQPMFSVMSNFCDQFEFGEREGDDVWLEGEITRDGQFVFNARIFTSPGNKGTVIDNFPVGPTKQGWTRRVYGDHEGYDLLDEDGELLFGYRVHEGVCFVAMDLMDKNGAVAVHGGQGGMVVQGALRFSLSHGLFVGNAKD